MIHVVVMKCLIGLPLLIRIELLRRSRSPSRSFKNRGVGVVVEVGAGAGVGSLKNRGVEVGVRAFAYRLHSPGYSFTFFYVTHKMKKVFTFSY
jgi:hypothetical protein